MDAPAEGELKTASAEAHLSVGPNPDLVALGADALSSTLLGALRSVVLDSRETGASHRLFVSLPPGFDSARSYPLLVALDANLCIGTVAEAATMSALTGEGRPVIVAGVGTSGDVATHGLRRLKDYLPSAPTGEMTTSGKLLADRVRAAGLRPEDAIGHADAFLGFIRNELFPYLLARLPVDADEVGLLGHSAGGAFASHALLSGAVPFTRFIMGSFGAGWHGSDLARREAAFAAALQRPVSVFHGWGGGELKDPMFAAELPSGSALLQRLAAANPLLTLIERQFDDETHASVLGHLIASGLRVHWPGGRWGAAGGSSAPAT